MRYLVVLIPVLLLSGPASADPPWEYYRGYERPSAPPRDRMEEWRTRERMEHHMLREYCEHHPWERECRR
jgi:hypothetical protein